MAAENALENSAPVTECFLAVYRGNLERLVEILDQLAPDTLADLLCGRTRDVRGRTLLQLAVFRGHLDILNVLVGRGAFVSGKIESQLGLTAIDEAVLRNDIEALQVLMKNWLNFAEKTSNNLYTKLFEDFKRIGPIYCEFKINLSPRFYLPFGFILPKETIKAYITETAFRIDMSIIGFNITWKYSDHTVVIKRKKNKHQMTYIHMLHKKKIYTKSSFDTSEAKAEGSENNFSELILSKGAENEQQLVQEDFMNELLERRIKTPVIRLDHKIDDIVFVPYKSLWTSIYNTFVGQKDTKSEDENDVTEYSVENINIDLIRMSEHLKENESASNPPNVVQSLENGTKNIIIKSHLNKMTVDEYFNADQYQHTYKSNSTKVKNLKLKIHSWNSKRYLGLLDKFVIPILELFKEHHYMAEEVIKFLKSPNMPGFPVRLQIPIFAILGDFELKNLFNVDRTVPNVTNTSLESCTIDSQAFEIPEDYKRVDAKEFYSNIKFNMADYLQKFNSTG